MSSTNDKMFEENQFLRAELQAARRQIRDLTDNNPLAPRLHRITLTLIEALSLLRRFHENPEVSKFLRKVSS